MNKMCELIQEISWVLKSIGIKLKSTRKISWYDRQEYLSTLNEKYQNMDKDNKDNDLIPKMTQ